MVQENDQVSIKQVNVMLKTRSEAGAGISLEVPFLNALARSAGATETTTQTIALVFTPAAPPTSMLATDERLQRAIGRMVSTVKALIAVAIDGV